MEKKSSSSPYTRKNPRALTDMILILDNIRSDFNVGSLFRTSDAMGCEKIYLCGITPTPLDRFDRENKKLTKVSLGAEKSVAWQSVQSTARLITILKKKGFTILALEQDAASVSLHSFSLSAKALSATALIVGTEVTGLSSDIRRHADTILEITMHGKKESLNVSVACGIAMFHLIHTATYA